MMFGAWCVARRKACSMEREVFPRGAFISQNFPNMVISGDLECGVRDFWTSSISLPSAKSVLIVIYS